MKKPVVDYSKLRWSTRKNPEYAHLKLLWGWVGYLLLYVLTENLIPYEKCHVIHSVVDDMVPFNEYFILAYTSWYVLIVGTLLYFMFYDVESFKKVQIFIIATQIIAMATYILYPSIQDLRPASFEHKNFCTFICGLIYKADTPTGVMPSLHVAYSMAIMSVWLKTKYTPWWFRTFIAALCFTISYSVMAVKQHSFWDVITAFIMCLIIEAILYRKYWMAKFKKSNS